MQSFQDGAVLSQHQTGSDLITPAAPISPLPSRPPACLSAPPHRVPLHHVDTGVLEEGFYNERVAHFSRPVKGG